MSTRTGTHAWALLGFCLLLSACAASGDITRPIPTAFFPAGQTATRLVVVLPGRGDDLASLERKRIAELVQLAWPAADVILTGLTLPFYREGRAPARLHDEIIVPESTRGNRAIWLLGISLGGMGALLHEHAYPDATEGMILLSPYLGDAAIQDEVRRSGGLGNWNPGPELPLGPDSFQRELWRTLKGWSQAPDQAASIWLAYGANEAFRQPIELMASALPSDHVLMLPGQHDWSLWLRAAQELLIRAAPPTGH